MVTELLYNVLKSLGIRIKKTYYKRIIEKEKQIAFLTFVSFLTTFIIARLYVYYLPGKYSFFLGEYHIHHFYYGIILIIIASITAIASYKKKVHYIASIIFGAGLGFLVDEIGFLLTEMKHYWAPETYAVWVSIVLLFICIILYDKRWFKKYEEKE